MLTGPDTHALIVTALPAEARPMIDKWRLKRDPASHAFPVYHGNHDGKLASLVVSGIGKVNAAAACAHLYNVCQPNNPVWLNVGLAGHASRDRGDTLLVHSIEDAIDGKTGYPPILFKPGCPSAGLISVDTVCRDYPDNALVDMEASAYFFTATKYTTAELVQSLKVVSDNRNCPPDDIDARSGTNLIANAIETVEHIVIALRGLSASLSGSNTESPTLPERFHLSTSQRRQLQHLIQQWRALNPEIPVPTDQLIAANTTRDLLLMFETLLDRQQVSYSA